MHEDKIIFKEEGRLARVILNNPARKNAITEQMRAAILDNLKKWVETPQIYAITIEASMGSPAEHQDPFSSGLDLMEIYQAFEQGPERALSLFKKEYETLWQIECYTKPLISVINGAIMGGSIGIAQYGTHIVAGENFSWSMPECKIGAAPDIGISYLLSKMPSSIGMYIGLTGRAINRDDACYLGLVEHCIDSKHFSAIRTAISDADPVDPLLDGLHQASSSSPLKHRAPIIDQIFSKKTIEEIIEALKHSEPEHKTWAKSVLDDLNAASPISLKVTHEAIQRAKTMQLHEALAQDYNILSHFLTGPEFIPAIKAKMIDKTTPTWTHSLVANITQAMVMEYFSENENFQENQDLKLNLPPRELGIDK